MSATTKLISHKVLKELIMIRTVEERFLRLFSEGKLNGTVHTCVGQELSAVAFAGQLKKRDFIFSNHRCHGHYISFTGDVRGLIAELLGRSSGTCGGIGSSQHLCKGNFYSNGVQGGIVPVAAGYALGNRLADNKAVGIVFIGDGTLGEGVLYETMNIISKWGIPLLIVCENNYYAQSTPQHVNLAGDILARAEAFGIQTYQTDTWQSDKIMSTAREAIDYVRETCKPAFCLVNTYRLNAHSKGDDDRDIDEIEHFQHKDFLNSFKRESPSYYEIYRRSIESEVDALIESILAEHDLELEKYYQHHNILSDRRWREIQGIAKRQVELINGFFYEKIGNDEKMVFLGEDVLSPYGGAFKVARGLSLLRPDRVFSTPISEAAITGLANGLALNGYKAFVEIMFGDFVTLALDQLINHASKFHHMFNKQVNCPMVLRTPMGARRGYGPTHSQTLDKFLVGIDNVKTVALNTFIDPAILYGSIYGEEHPVVVIENKVDYGKRILSNPLPNFVYEANEDAYPVVRIRPVLSAPTVTLVAYGGVADVVAKALNRIFIETELKPELIVPSLISHLPVDIIKDAIEITGRLVVIEEGTSFAGIGSELISAVMEQISSQVQVQIKRITAHPVPIPAVKSLENEIVPDEDRIIREIKQRFC